MYFTLPRNQHGCVALTFDDGPHAEVTPRVLDALARKNTRASFFFQGSAAKSWPDIVRRAHQEGHVIASHGVTHESARRQTREEAVCNAAQCHAYLEDIVGSPLRKLYRPPYGELTVSSLIGIVREGFQLAFWNYDSNDSFVSDADGIVKRVTTSPPRTGSIVLLHDDYAITALALPRILVELERRNLKPISL